MEEENTVVAPDATEGVALETTDSAEGEPEEESVEDLKARLAKAEEYGRNQKIRAEKAEKLKKEKEAKIPEQPKPTPVEVKISTKDLLALTKANIDEADIEIVEKYAKFEGISIAEALKSEIVKATISDRAEKRNVALATNTSSSRRSSAKVSDDALLSNAASGKLPESEEEITRLVRLKMGLKN